MTEAFTADQAKVIFDTNVVGLLRTSRAVLPTMRAQGDGLIIAFAADAVNDAVAPIQHRVLEGLGLSALTILAKKAA